LRAWSGRGCRRCVTITTAGRHRQTDRNQHEPSTPKAPGDLHTHSHTVLRSDRPHARPSVGHRSADRSRIPCTRTRLADRGGSRHTAAAHTRPRAPRIAETRGTRLDEPRQPADIPEPGGVRTIRLEMSLDDAIENLIARLPRRVLRRKRRHETASSKALRRRQIAHGELDVVDPVVLMHGALRSGSGTQVLRPAVSSSGSPLSP
jgi:hypothetical protein